MTSKERPVFGEPVPETKRPKKPERHLFSFIIDSLEAVDRTMETEDRLRVERRPAPEWAWFWTPRREKGVSYQTVRELTNPNSSPGPTPENERFLEAGRETEQRLKAQYRPLSLASNLRLVDEETRTFGRLDDLIKVWFNQDEFVPVGVDYRSISHERFLKLIQEEEKLKYPKLAGPFTTPSSEDRAVLNANLYLLRKDLGIKAPVGIVVYADRDRLDTLYGLVEFDESEARKTLGLSGGQASTGLSPELEAALARIPEITGQIATEKFQARQDGRTPPAWVFRYLPREASAELVYPRVSEISKCSLMSVIDAVSEIHHYQRLPKGVYGSRRLAVGGSADTRMKREFSPLGVGSFDLFSSRLGIKGELDSLIRAYHKDTEYEWVDVSFKIVSSGQFKSFVRQGMPAHHRVLPDIDTRHPFVNPRDFDALQENFYLSLLNEIGIKTRFAIVVYENADQTGERKYSLVEHDPDWVADEAKRLNQLLQLARKTPIQELYDREAFFPNPNIRLSRGLVRGIEEENETLVIPIPGVDTWLHFVCDYAIDCPHPEGWKAARQRLKDPEGRLTMRKLQRMEASIRAKAEGRGKRKRSPTREAKIGRTRRYPSKEAPPPVKPRLKPAPEDLQIGFPEFEGLEKKQARASPSPRGKKGN